MGVVAETCSTTTLRSSLLSKTSGPKTVLTKFSAAGMNLSILHNLINSRERRDWSTGMVWEGHTEGTDVSARSRVRNDFHEWSVSSLAWSLKKEIRDTLAR